MQIGIDLGETKIESVLLDNNGSELHRSRKESPKNYKETLNSIIDSVKIIENKFKKNLTVGVCHPGSTNLDTGLIQNAYNSPWLNNMKFSDDISKYLNRKVLCENDANCFALSEAFDGSAQHYKIVFGIILGSGCGGGLVIDKKILVGPNAFAGEWGHVPIGKSKKDHNIEENKNIILHGKLKLDPSQLECEWDGKQLPDKLTTTEFLIVKELAKRPGIIKERSQLMDVAYREDTDIEDRTIDSHVKRIRKKFKKVDNDFSAIETRYGSGYRWNVK